MKVFLVMKESYGGLGGYYSHTSVDSVFLNRKVASTYCKEKNEKATKCVYLLKSKKVSE